MDEDMQRHSVSLCTVILAIAAPFGLVAATHRSTMQASDSAIRQYCNEQYMYCVTLPSSGKAEPHEGDAPNHGVTLKLQEPENEAWTYAHWDAALLGSSQKAALQRFKAFFSEHPTAEVSMAPIMIAGLSAYRIRFSYVDIRPVTEELVIAYSKPKDASQGPGIIYEIGLKCSQKSYAANASTLDSLIATFRRTGE